MFCNQCGAQIGDEARFCNCCGFQVTDLSGPEGTANAVSDLQNAPANSFTAATQESPVRVFEPAQPVEPVQPIFSRIGAWCKQKKDDCNASYQALSPGVRKILCGSMVAVVILMAAIWYWTIPKISNVETLTARGDAQGLCAMIEKHAKSEKYLPVMRAAAKAILDINDASAVERVSAVIPQNSYNTKVRTAIIDQFTEHNMIVPRLFEQLADNNCPEEVKKALVAATNKVNSGLFDEKVEQELLAAKQLVPTDVDAAIAAVIKTKVFDPNQTKTGRIDNVLYETYAYKLKKISYPAGNEQIKTVLAAMGPINSSSRTKDDALLVKINGLIAQDESLATSLNQIDGKVAAADKDIQAAQSNVNGINSYLANCRYIRAFLIDAYDDGTYEISFNLWNPRDRAVLKTTRTTFSSKGWFEMYVRNLGTKQISLLSGGIDYWPYLEEDDEAQVKSQQLISATQILSAAEYRKRAILSDKKQTELKRSNIQNEVNQSIRQLGGQENFTNLPEPLGTQTVVSRALAYDELSLAGIRPGTNINNAKKLLGTPAKVEKGTHGTIYSFNGVELTVIDSNGRIGTVVIDRANYATSRGIKVGSSLHSVIAAYGDTTPTAYQNTDLYEYVYDKVPEQILRFAVNRQSGKVDYVGLRLKNP